MSRPYFETEIVKVKKEKDFKCEPRRYCGECWLSIHCPIYKGTKKEEKPKSNWVNGENLDKIKFPCFCWYLSGAGKRYCELDFIQYDKGFYRVKELKQYNMEDIKAYCCAEFWNVNLQSLIKSLHLHILKGKIIIYEGEE